VAWGGVGQWDRVGKRFGRHVGSIWGENRFRLSEALTGQGICGTLGFQVCPRALKQGSGKWAPNLGIQRGVLKGATYGVDMSTKGPVQGKEPLWAQKILARGV